MGWGGWGARCCGRQEPWAGGWEIWAPAPEGQAFPPTLVGKRGIKLAPAQFHCWALVEAELACDPDALSK